MWVLLYMRDGMCRRNTYWGPGELEEMIGYAHHCNHVRNNDARYFVVHESELSLYFGDDQ